MLEQKEIQMAIITISRELAALGDETGRELADLLKYRFIDKRLLEERIKSYGDADQKLQKYDERRRSFLASFSQDHDDYLHYLKTAVLAEAGSGSCIIIGRGANVIFKSIPGVLSIFLVAPLEIRIERVKSYFHCDARRARQIIEQSDRDRESFHHYFFDMEWRYSGNYHLTLNTGCLHPTICAEILKYVRDELITPEAEDRNAQHLREMALGQQVKHHILYEKEIPIHFLETAVSGAIVTLYGVANSQSLVESALGVARTAFPQHSIQSEIQVVHEYSVMP
jgi:cytidylate kinase